MGLVNERGEAFLKPKRREKQKGQAPFRCIEALWFSRRLLSKPVPTKFVKKILKQIWIPFAAADDVINDRSVKKGKIIFRQLVTLTGTNWEIYSLTGVN